MGEWISVKDRLPEAGQFVLAYYGNFYGYIVEAMEWTGELWRNSERIAEIPDVITHWMPLPEPPKEG